MNNKEILEKAIQKAIDGGWQHPYKGSSDFKYGVIWHELGDWQYIKVGFDSMVGMNSWDVQKLIFNHDFAKALWGDFPLSTATWTESPSKKYTTRSNLPNWQFHLQNMVIAEDPIKYLGDNI